MRYSKVLIYAICISIFLVPAILYGQGDQLTRDQLQDMTSTSGTIITKPSTSTIGSPFFTEDFIKGHIMLDKNSQTATIYLRYDMEKNNVQFLRKDEILATESTQITGFKIYANPSNIIFKNGFKTSIKEITPNTLLRVVHDAKLKLLVLYKAKLHENIASYGTATKTNKYNIYKKYYLVSEDGKFHLIKPEEKSILNILSDKSGKLQSYAQENALRFDNEQDLVKIIKMYEIIL